MCFDFLKLSFLSGMIMNHAYLAICKSNLYLKIISFYLEFLKLSQETVRDISDKKNITIVLKYVLCISVSFCSVAGENYPIYVSLYTSL